jgi:hypothetical protein
MKPINDFENIQASTGESNRLKPGGYICKITEVKDVPINIQGKGDYLKIEYDIADGEFKWYFKEQFEKWKNWNGNFIRSYKEKALGMFKHFINCVEESNVGYRWDWNETELIGRLVGLVIGEEEYIKKSGEIGTRTYVKEIKTVEQIRNGDFKIPELKKLHEPNFEPNFDGASYITNFVPLGDDDELPFA